MSSKLQNNYELSIILFFKFYNVWYIALFTSSSTNYLCSPYKATVINLRCWFSSPIKTVFVNFHLCFFFNAGWIFALFLKTFLVKLLTLYKCLISSYFHITSIPDTLACFSVLFQIWSIWVHQIVSITETLKKWDSEYKLFNKKFCLSPTT